jgi:hypothetical protein
MIRNTCQGQGAGLRLHDRAPKNVLSYSTPYYCSQSDGGDLLRQILRDPFTDDYR